MEAQSVLIEGDEIFPIEVDDLEDYDMGADDDDPVSVVEDAPPDDVVAQISVTVIPVVTDGDEDDEQLDDEAMVIGLSVEGIPGRVCHTMSGYALYGKWASHTGYQSLSGHGAWGYVPARDEFDAFAKQFARQRYFTQRALPFLVGEEHKEHGWKTIEVGYSGLVTVRLPRWHEGLVAAVLTEMGMRQECNFNNHWVFDAKVTLVQAKEALAPIIRRSTRFCDEQQLAQALSVSARQAGLIGRIDQMALF